MVVHSPSLSCGTAGGADVEHPLNPAAGPDGGKDSLNPCGSHRRLSLAEGVDADVAAWRAARQGRRAAGCAGARRHAPNRELDGRTGHSFSRQAEGAEDAGGDAGVPFVHEEGPDDLKRERRSDRFVGIKLDVEGVERSQKS